jgi:arylformamidase
MHYQFDKAIDLTQELANGMPIYPGDPEPSFEPAATLAKNGVNLTRLELGSHTGTHTDAPIHFIEGGIPVDKIPVSKLVGEALVVDLSDKPVGSGITGADLEKISAKLKPEDDIVLLYTGCSALWGNPSVNSNYTYLTEDGAKYLVSKKVRAVGIDFLSVEKFKAPKPVAHKTLLGNGIFIIESLSGALKQLIGQRVFLINFPIKLENGDGAPSRSVAVPISNED